MLAFLTLIGGTVSGLLAIGSGLALGREGPSVQMGAIFSYYTGRIFRRNWSDCRALLAAGEGDVGIAQEASPLCESCEEAFGSDESDKKIKRGPIMSSPVQPLGRSGMRITRVGFGSWAVGGGGWSFGWGPQKDAESLAAMRHAIGLGVNWIDTAAVYGLGHSEEIVGMLIKELPAAERPFIFTKCGLVWDEHRPMSPPRRVLKPDSIRRECEASLRRLGVERIDLYQFHWPDDTGTPVEDSWAAMLKLVEEGKVRAPGVSNFNTDLLGRCEAIRHVDSLQPPFSMINRSAAAGEIPWCAGHETGVICYSPMQSGLLTDSFTKERVKSFPDDDWRHMAPQFKEPELSRNLALRDALRPIAERHGASASAVSVAWVLAWPGVTGAIVGARRPEQVDGWIKAALIRLTEQDLSEIDAAIARTGAGAGPTAPPSGGKK